MKKGLTELVFILDQSGSMYNLVDDTVGGFNTMIEKQKGIEGEANVSLILFNNIVKMVYDNVPLEKIEPLTTETYFPGGSTALYDAIGGTVSNVGRRLSNTKEEERPEKVIVVVTTDGYENASKEYTSTKISDMIKHQREKYSWEFIFLGADLDTVEKASQLGFNPDFTCTWTTSSAGMESYTKGLSNAISTMRSCDLANGESYTAVTNSLKSIDIERNDVCGFTTVTNE